MKDYWNDKVPVKKLNKKKISITIYILILIIVLIVLFCLYISSQDARNWIDKNILRKEINQNNVSTIDLDSENNYKIYAYDKNIAVLNHNTLKIYNDNGKEEKSLDVQINNAIFKSNNKFLVIAEEKGQEVYVISGTEILWKGQVDGNISQIHVNKNGYVAIVITDTSYKTVINFYNPNGERKFVTFLSSTRVVDTSISNDNKYLAIAEIDSSGSYIQSNVKIISIEKANDKSNTGLDDSITYIYKADANRLITNLRYQDKNNLICKYNDGIDLINNNGNTSLVTIGDKKTTFMSIKLSNNVVSVEEKSSGLFTADSVVKIMNTTNKKENLYNADGVAKDIVTYDDIIGLNFGTEIHFINTNGWLIKKYIANQEITNVVLSGKIAGIIYRDRIEIVNL